MRPGFYFSRTSKRLYLTRPLCILFIIMAIFAADFLPVYGEEAPVKDDEQPSAVLKKKQITGETFSAGTGNKSQKNSSRENTGVRFSLGISGHYAWWDPIWGNMSMIGDMLIYALLNQSVPFLKLETPSRKYEVDPAFMGGINFKVDFKKGWRISAQAVVGAYQDSSVMVKAMTNNPFALSEYVKYRIDSITFDTSVTASYRITSWLGLSSGAVYQGFTLKEQNSSYLFSFSKNSTVHLFGGKAGTAFSIRMIENLSIKPEIFFLGLYGITAGGDNSSPSIALGGIVKIPFTYYLEKVHITLSLGFRYRFLYYLEPGNSDYINRWDHRYGITESVTYNF